jgi:DNA adenine methylase
VVSAARIWSAGDRIGKLSGAMLRHMRVDAIMRDAASPDDFVRVVEALEVVLGKVAELRDEKHMVVEELDEAIADLSKDALEKIQEAEEERDDAKREADEQRDRVAGLEKNHDGDMAALEARLMGSLAAVEKEAAALKCKLLAAELESASLRDAHANELQALEGALRARSVLAPANDDPPLAPARRPRRAKPEELGKSPRTARPPFKSAGGKTKLLGELMARIPQTFGAYHEPFVGGGALFWALAEAGRITTGATLTDNNPVLARTYLAIRDSVEHLIDRLSMSPFRYDRVLFEEVRALGFADVSDVEAAARFLYLNRTCFNGLWRVNKAGQFNVPFGSYTNPTICDAANLRRCSEMLTNVTLAAAPFERVLEDAAKGDLVYFDPPYVPLTATSNFASYTKEAFKFEDHVRLRDVALELRRRGVVVLVSNSDTPVVRELYGRDFSIEEVRAPRAINSKAERRGDVTELVIR